MPNLQRQARWLLLFGLLAHLTSLTVGFLADDHFHRLLLEGGVQREASALRLGGSDLAPLSLYDFGDATEASGPAFVQGGVPWWISDTWRVQFFRPLAAASLWFDHQLFGRWAPGHHAVSWMLFIAVLALARRVLANLGLNRTAVAIALAWIAVDESSVIPVGWLANRNTLIEAILGLAALATLGPVGSRVSVGRAGLAVGLSLAAAGAKESGLIFIVLTAWELGARSNGWVARTWLALGPTLALGVVLGWMALGAGAQSQFYPEPWEAPLEVAVRGGKLLVLGLASGWTPLPMDMAHFRPATEPWLLLCALPIALGTVVGLRASLRTPAGRRLALAGVALLAPQAAAPLSERLLFLPQMALAGLLGMAFEQLTPGWRRRVFAPLAAACALGVAIQLGALSVLSAEARSQVLRAVDMGREAGASHVLLAQQAHPLVALVPGAHAAWERPGAGVSLWPLQAGGRAIDISRLDEKRFLLEFTPGDLLTNALEPVFLAPGDAPEEGRRWSTPLFDVIAVRVRGNGLEACELHFREPPERLGVLSVGGSRGTLEVRPWPEVGERVHWPATRSAVPVFP